MIRFVFVILASFLSILSAHSNQNSSYELQCVIAKSINSAPFKLETEWTERFNTHLMTKDEAKSLGNVPSLVGTPFYKGSYPLLKTNIEVLIMEKVNLRRVTLIKEDQKDRLYTQIESGSLKTTITHLYRMPNVTSGTLDKQVVCTLTVK